MCKLVLALKGRCCMYSNAPDHALKEEAPKIITELSKLSQQIDQVHDIILQMRTRLNPVLKKLPKCPQGEQGSDAHPYIGAPVYEKIQSVSMDLTQLKIYAISLMEDIDL